MYCWKNGPHTAIWFHGLQVSGLSCLDCLSCIQQCRFPPEIVSEAAVVRSVKPAHGRWHELVGTSPLSGKSAFPPFNRGYLNVRFGSKAAATDCLRQSPLYPRKRTLFRTASRVGYSLSSQCRAGLGAGCPLCHHCRRVGGTIWGIPAKGNKMHGQLGAVTQRKRQVLCIVAIQGVEAVVMEPPLGA